MYHEERQIGWFAIVPFGVILIFLFFGYIYQWGSRPIPFTAYIILSVVFLTCALLFYQMKVRADPEKITVSYGIGLIRKKIPLSKIREVRAVKNKWFYGLGIRKIRNGWLYNIHGLQAVEISYLDSDKVVRIGTADNENLKTQVEVFLGKLVAGT